MIKSSQKSVHIPIGITWLQDIPRVVVAGGIIAAGIAYLFYPLDIIPDFTGPIVGWIDDAVVMMLAGFAARRILMESKELWGLLTK